MKIWTILPLGLSIAFAAMYPCVTAASPSLKALLAAPEKLSIADRTVVLKAYLWRDFQPISPPDGKPLIASLKLETTDETSLPSGIQVESVWVINDKELWSPTQKTVDRADAGSSAMGIVIRNGPKWAPGIKVDVVVQVKAANGRAYLLRASDQPIDRTD